MIDDQILSIMLMLSKKKSTSHVLHLTLSIVTVGLWIPVWVIVALSNSIYNARIDRKADKL